MVVIGLHDSEDNKYPNLALMKLSAWHKKQKNKVSWFIPIMSYDIVYSSKVFTYTRQDRYIPNDSIKGGTGYNIITQLKEEIEHVCPDYSLYHCSCSYGFTTRGCTNSCPWCIVPLKEGKIKDHAEIEEFTRHDKLVLMDNNILASKHGIKQIEKIREKRISIDFNQGLDARLVTEKIGKLLSSIRYLKALRFSLDKQENKKALKKAVNRVITKQPIFVYVLVTEDTEDSLDRILFVNSLGCDPFAMPERKITNQEPTQAMKNLARWCNHKAIFKSIPFSQYKP